MVCDRMRHISTRLYNYVICRGLVRDLGIVWLWVWLSFGVGVGVTSVTAQGEGAAPALAWSSAEVGRTQSVAWGDYDNDGDLDLAVGDETGPNRLYRNDDGVLTPSFVWESLEKDPTYSLAWGDYDNDGDLDLAVGNSLSPNRVYRNDNGTLSTTAVWSSVESDGTLSVAWGDYDGDGDLDLVAGNSFSPNRLYRNDNGILTTSTVWSSTEIANTRNVAWGDYDSDGDLDLAAGGSGFIRLYRNDSRGLSVSAEWEANEQDGTVSLAWGDYDGDGDLDLAVANLAAPNRLYRNDGGRLNPGAVWWSSDSENTYSLAWADYDNDGDLDLAVGNERGSNRLYRNDSGSLTQTAVWSTPEIDNIRSVAWGDYDNDGDLDLAVGSRFAPTRLYRNDSVGLTASAVQAFTITDGQANGLAWGDYDGDGDLDLALGVFPGPNRLYRNQDGVLGLDNGWSPTDFNLASSVAWGDYDSDGDLDLALGNGQGFPDRVYRNEAGRLGSTAIWFTTEISDTRSVAWGDYDGDGDLDMAVGGSWSRNRLYQNTNGILGNRAAWLSDEQDDVSSVAWGDYDNDGDLDLAIGNMSGPNRLYRNDSGQLTTQAVWSSTERERTLSIAWADYDGDGDLDLAVGNSEAPNRLYRNEIGLLSASAVWSANESDGTTSIAWGDYDNDGDPDLAVGNFLAPNKLYRNDGGRLTASAIWATAESDGTLSIAWGDYDNDGNLDLAAGNYLEPNRLYRNGPATSAGMGDRPMVHLSRPRPPAEANYYSSSTIHAGPTLTFNYTLTHPRDLSIRKVEAWYSLNGGGQWLPATASTNTQTTHLSSSPTGVSHTYTWDVYQSGLMGQSDNVVFRLIAHPALTNTVTHLPGPYLYGAYASQTFPFRVRGTQVRVMQAGQPVRGATVYRLPAGATRGAAPLASGAGGPFTTNAQGYLGGHSQLQAGDGLVALVPSQVTATHTLYLTNAPPTATGLSIPPITASGIQTLTVSSDYPLAVFDLDVALEWDARQDTQFLNQLDYDLRRASEFLYDWGNGQLALGRIRVFQDKERWDEAHIRVYASNRVRPNAVKGGIVTAPLEETIADSPPRTLNYAPGQVRMGAVWTRYGDTNGSLGEDWPRALAHELGHFALFLDDNYLGLRGQRLIEVQGCPGAMSDPYRTDTYSEFHPATAWSPACDFTLSNHATGRSDWETITTFYPALQAPNVPMAQVNPGPNTLPLAITHVEFQPLNRPATLDVPLVFLTDAEGGRITTTPGIRAILYQGQSLIDLGRPTLDQVRARGGRPGDEVCAYDLGQQRLGCRVLTAGSEPLQLTTYANWRPEIKVTPVTSTTLTVEVRDAPPDLALFARLYPVSGPAIAPVRLAATDGVYRGVYQLSDPVLEGYLRVWVDEAPPRREAITDYALGGGPGHAWAYDAPRGSQGRLLARDVPAISSDGQVTLFVEDTQLPEEGFVALQAATKLPAAPSWATPIGQGYWLTATANAPLDGTSLIFSYLGSDVPPGEERWLHVYFRHDMTGQWERLDTELDTHHNVASALVQGPGLYALMSSIQVQFTTPGWNLFGYAAPEPQSVAEALASITGYYTLVYGYDPANTTTPWQVYDPSAPDYVNLLRTLEPGQGYWVYVTAPITLYLRGGWPDDTARASKLDMMPTSPPATYYGNVQSGAGFTPRAGMTVRALIGGQTCGQGRTITFDGQLVYTLYVLADTPGAAAGCGAPGRAVVFEIDGRTMGATVPWHNERGQAFPLSPIPPRPIKPAVFRQGHWLWRDTLHSGNADTSVGYGVAGDIPLVCDWDGDGTRTPGVFRNGAWFLRNSRTSGDADVILRYGGLGDAPVCGDWDGDGVETVGVRRNNVWHLRNSNTSGVADHIFQYGLDGDRPVVGDWDGDGDDTVGIVRSGVWHLRQSNTNGSADIVFPYGLANDMPLVGDWDGDGRDSVGVVRLAHWFLRQSTTAGPGEVIFAYGLPTDMPLLWR